MRQLAIGITPPHRACIHLLWTRRRLRPCDFTSILFILRISDKWIHAHASCASVRLAAFLYVHARRLASICAVRKAMARCLAAEQGLYVRRTPVVLPYVCPRPVGCSSRTNSLLSVLQSAPCSSRKEDDASPAKRAINLWAWTFGLGVQFISGYCSLLMRLAIRHLRECLLR
jgi:hypothetical protein